MSGIRFNTRYWKPGIHQYRTSKEAGPRHRMEIILAAACFMLATCSFLSDISKGEVWFRDFHSSISRGRIFRSPDKKSLLYVDGVGPDGLALDLNGKTVSRPDAPITTPFFADMEETSGERPYFSGKPSGSEGFPASYQLEVDGNRIALFCPYGPPVHIELR